ncbi:helix-turn-helix domain-containing protein [Sphingobacterium sp. HJSM2_6]|uniref:helix-turn-helix domain-containing protein n=1 Tax=Sphingobacterium sp. HJSM2_6 TaxID=3366264 RepID=UPI003BBE3BB6
MSYSKIIYNILFSAFGISWIFYPIVVFVKANKSSQLIFQIKRLFYYSIILLFLISAFIIPLITTSIIHGTINRSPISEIIMYSIMLLATVIICNYYIKKYLQTNLIASKPSTKEHLNVEVTNSLNLKIGNKSVLYEEIINSYLDQKTYLNQNFSLDVMVDDIGLSKTFLIDFFKSNYNQSFIKKINELRIEEACLDLNSDNLDINIDELAFKNGYSSRASFYRHFSKLKNCSPSEYRAQYKKTN